LSIIAAEPHLGMCSTVMIGEDFTFICDGCIAEAARIVAERKAH
jgi:hypothetical protein